MQKNNMAEGEEFMKKFTEITGAKFVDVTPKTELDLIDERVDEQFMRGTIYGIDWTDMEAIKSFYRQEITKLLEKKREELCKEMIKNKSMTANFQPMVLLDKVLQIIKSKI